MISGIAHLFMMVKDCAVNKGQTPARFLMLLVLIMQNVFLMDQDSQSVYVNQAGLVINA